MVTSSNYLKFWGFRGLGVLAVGGIIGLSGLNYIAPTPSMILLASLDTHMTMTKSVVTRLTNIESSVATLQSDLNKFIENHPTQ